MRKRKFHYTGKNIMRKLKEQEAGKKKEKEHVTNARESTLRNTFQQAIQFYALPYLCKAPDSKYKWMNFLRLDFKNAYSPIPTVDDICKTLTAENVEIVKKLEEHLAGTKVKAKIKPLRGIVSDFKWKVEYICKAKNICGFYADNEYFMLCIYFNHFANITAFAQTLYKEDCKLFHWFQEQFPERLCKCPNNRRVYFGDEPRRICGLSNRAEIVNPDGEDVDRALYLLKRRLEEI